MLLSNKKSKKIFTIVLSTIFASLLGMLCLVVSELGDMQLQTLNSLYRSQHTPDMENFPICIIGIDSEYFVKRGKWPLPQQTLAQAIQNINQAGASIIATDLELYQQAGQLADTALVKTLQNCDNVILSGKLVLEPGHPSLTTQYILSPQPELLQNTTWGLCNLAEDHDGCLRNYNLFHSYNGDLYFSLALQVYFEHFQLNPDVDFIYNNNKLVLGGRNIPIRNDYTLPLSFLGPKNTIPTIPLHEVVALHGNQSDSALVVNMQQQHMLQNKIVLIGVVDTNSMYCKTTPFSYGRKITKVPDIEVHATAINTLISHAFLHHADKKILVSISIILAFITAAVCIRLLPWQALLFFIGELLLIRLAIWFAFSRWGILTSYCIPTVTTCTAFLLMILRYYFLKHLEKKKIRKVVERYVSPNIMHKMLNSKNLPNFSGERRDLTVLVSDLRHFTAFLQTHEASTIVSRLSEYLKEVEQIIYEQQGSLDKFVGDEIMAVFGAPFPVADHAERACVAAVEMVNKLRFLQKKYSQERQPYFNIGIGINTGQSITGNISGSNMYDFTFIGEEISLGAHIEHANKTYSTTILMAENTYEQVKNRICAREIDHIRFIGSQRAIRLYELRGVQELPDIEQELIIDRFTEGLTLYRNRHYAEALMTFRQVLRYFPSDGPSRLYTIRCLNALEAEPAASWDGIHDIKIF